MKKVTKILAVLALGSLLLLTGCIKETFPTHYASQELVDDSPEGLSVALYAWSTTRESSRTGLHAEFGMPAMGIALDLMGSDVVTLSVGYNHFRAWYDIVSYQPENVQTAYVWEYLNRYIFMANGRIRQLPYEDGVDKMSPNDLRDLSEARLFRAYALYTLIHFYGPAYTVAPDAPGVPIVTEKTTEEEIKNNPRASVKDAYDLIVSDLDFAVENLSATRSNKAKINVDVAHALRARVAMSMGDWDKAEKHAKSVIGTGKYKAMSESEYLDPVNGFNDMGSQSSWIWCIDITEDDNVVRSGILNFTSMMSNLYLSGYSVSLVPKMIDKALYDAIPESDFRKKAFLSKPTVHPSYAPLPIPDNQKLWLRQYANVKFIPKDANYGSSTSAAADYVITRIEEMQFIEAEAVGRRDLAAGKALLEKIVQTRDPEFVSKATSKESFINEVWVQKRIEFWGEGLSQYDTKRLDKGVIRSYEGTNHPETIRFNTTKAPDWFMMPMPRSEITNNKALSPEVNNPTPDRPKADSDPHPNPIPIID